MFIAMNVIEDSRSFRSAMSHMLLLKEQELGESIDSYKHLAPDGASPL
jgi:hypothetical protein